MQNTNETSTEGNDPANQAHSEANETENHEHKQERLRSDSADKRGNPSLRGSHQLRDNAHNVSDGRSRSR